MTGRSPLPAAFLQDLPGAPPLLPQTPCLASTPRAAAHRSQVGGSALPVADCRVAAARLRGRWRRRPGTATLMERAERGSCIVRWWYKIASSSAAHNTIWARVTLPPAPLPPPAVAPPPPPRGLPPPPAAPRSRTAAWCGDCGGTPRGPAPVQRWCGRGPARREGAENEQDWQGETIQARPGTSAMVAWSRPCQFGDEDAGVRRMGARPHRGSNRLVAESTLHAAAASCCSARRHHRAESSEPRALCPAAAAHHADVGAGMELGAALPHDDVPRRARLPPKQLHAQVLGQRVLGVLRGAALLLGRPARLLPLPGPRRRAAAAGGGDGAAAGAALAGGRRCAGWSRAYSRQRRRGAWRVGQRRRAPTSAGSGSRPARAPASAPRASCRPALLRERIAAHKPCIAALGFAGARCGVCGCGGGRSRWDVVQQTGTKRLVQAGENAELARSRRGGRAAGGRQLAFSAIGSPGRLPD